MVVSVLKLTPFFRIAISITPLLRHPVPQSYYKSKSLELKPSLRIRQWTFGDATHRRRLLLTKVGDDDDDGDVDDNV
ncbi:hypothetical protein EVAR_51094_1 [Eumeta japonica]|uniref:Uncharacterized protein n=1 Tax=Eumeta variegata TaxID=151549 RepID=A0A4C1XNF0_EUMVA|nr:hypothetical protein EVAR_51094_1 [Eumeta japonica]